jgi:thymidylate synthase
MNNLDLQYQNLLRDILESGVVKETRNGETLAVFGRQIRHNLNDGFPLLTTKKMAIKSIMTELKWFLKGRTDIEYLRENNCRIWDGDYLASGRTDGDLGPIYGYQWRNWNNIGYNGDQIANLLPLIFENRDYL